MGGRGDYGRCHGAPSKGGGAIADARGLLSREVGLKQMPGVSFQRRWAYSRSDRSPFKEGRVIADAMGRLSREVGL